MLAYEILRNAGLEDYYRLNANPGVSLQSAARRASYAEYDDDRILCQVCDFQNDRHVDVTLHVPQIHCTSCVWLLENLHRLIPGIRHSQVDFFKKTVSIGFERSRTTLRAIAEMLDSLGYAPSPRDAGERADAVLQARKTLYLKIGVAGFCFGNVMLLSFPEYLLSGGESLEGFGTLFASLTLALSLPVLFYSASDYFASAWRAVKTRAINIEVPLAIGLFSLFARSLFDILVHHRLGFLDSFTGLVFFLLIGRLFKEKTFDALNFERTYESYFPLSVTRRSGGEERTVPLAEIRPGDRLRIRNQELIPADSVLKSVCACIDYSFVTGESLPQKIERGETVYAGGRQCGEAVEVEVVKSVSQSHLTRLWNDSSFKETKRKRFTQVSNHVGRLFTWATLAIGLASGVFWSFSAPERVVPVVTSVLLVACPCALALAFPFTFGTAMRILGKNGVYLKNMDVLESLSWIDTVVLDKTGTLTISDQDRADFIPSPGHAPLSPSEESWVRSVAANSVHPLSVALNRGLFRNPILTVRDFQEFTGRGLQAKVGSRDIRIGSAAFVSNSTLPDEAEKSLVYVSIGGELRGAFRFARALRPSLKKTIAALFETYRLILLSGDDPRDADVWARDIFTESAAVLRFRQSPKDKMDFVADQMRSGRFVAMIGDGLNDAGALRQSDVGIAITDDINAFSPSSDVILAGRSFPMLPQVFAAAKICMRVLSATVALSLAYNLIGLGFAVSGKLSPFVSAVLMPISSISVMAVSSFATRWNLKRSGFGVAKEEKKNPDSIQILNVASQGGS